MKVIPEKVTKGDTVTAQYQGQFCSFIVEKKNQGNRIGSSALHAGHTGDWIGLIKRGG